MNLVAIVTRRGKKQIQKLVVAEDQTRTIGRSWNCDIVVDDKYVDAVYSIGALYYNKAASTTKEMKALEDDYSPAGTRKFEAKKAEMMGFFDQALPHFQRAETLNPNDRNTLIALKEIYARKDDLEKTKEFKTRLDNITNEIDNKSYFGNQ